MSTMRLRRTTAPARWEVRPAWEACGKLARQLGVSEIIAQLLYNRGLSEAAQARLFLQPSLSDLLEPQRLCGIDAAVKRIRRAIQDDEKIVLYGDYDVDGITGVSILWHCLHLGGKDVEYYVPHRLAEGYGLNSEAITHLAEKGAKLIITVDCGITACAEIAQARQLGLDVIITDHHTFDAQLPDACAIVHPGLTEPPYPTRDLCGAAVAFKLAWALAQEFSGAQKVSDEFRAFLIKATGLVALGTVADVVPLLGENRVLVSYGMQGLAHSEDVGIAALLSAAGLTGAKLDSMDVAFKLAPRLNAAGRMGHARLAVELFTRSTAVRAREIATYLESQNKLRQKVEKDITAQAKEQLEQLGMNAEEWGGFVLAGEKWHGGVVGIVASRIVDRFHRPTVVIAIDGDKAVGSGRSIPGFDLHEALAACSEHLEGFGGHAMAAGLQIRPENIPAFREAFNAYALAHAADETLERILNIDAEVQLDQLDLPTVEMMHRLAPFGQGNPPVRLLARGLKLAGPTRTMGQRGDHLQLFVASKDDLEPHMRPGGVLRVVGFGKARWDKQLADAESFDLVLEPRINRYGGSASVECFAEDLKCY